MQDNKYLSSINRSNSHETNNPDDVINTEESKNQSKIIYGNTNDDGHENSNMTSIKHKEQNSEISEENKDIKNTAYTESINASKENFQKLEDAKNGITDSVDGPISNISKSTLQFIKSDFRRSISAGCPKSNNYGNSIVCIEPTLAFGLRTDVIGNVHFSSNDEVMYPIENVLVFHNVITKSQSFVKMPDFVKVKTIAMDNARSLIAVLVSNVKVGHHLIIYDMEYHAKLFTRPFPESYKHNEIRSMKFSADCKSVFVLSKAPNEILFCIRFGSIPPHCVYVHKHCSSLETIETIAPHPTEGNLVAIGGKTVLRLLSRLDRTFSTVWDSHTKYHISSIDYLKTNVLIAGTTNDLIILFNAEKGAKLDHIKASEGTNFNLAINGSKRQKIHHKPQNEKLSNSIVSCLVCFQRGFAYALYDKVFVFEQISSGQFERKTIISMHIFDIPNLKYDIRNIAIEPKEQTLVVTTSHSQIYIGILIVPETLKTKFLKFVPLGARVHKASITDMAICSWRPIILTASSDQTVRIWNYQTSEMELLRRFQSDILAVAMEATGLMIAIGFPEILRICRISMDDLRVIKTFSCPNCRNLQYSNFGHFLAAAYSNTIVITSVNLFQKITTLQAPTGDITSISWSTDDKYLVASTKDSVIIQWDIETGEKLQQIQQSNVKFLSVYGEGGNPMNIYAATNIGYVYVYANSIIKHKVLIQKHVPLTNLCMSKRGTILFVSSEDGCIFHVDLPLRKKYVEEDDYKCFNIFGSRINKMLFSIDEKNLIAISKAGTLLIFKLSNTENKLIEIDQDLLKSTVVTVSRNVLVDTNKAIRALELMLVQHSEEYKFQLHNTEASEEQQLIDTTYNYCNALKDLRNVDSEMKRKHIAEMNMVTQQVRDIINDHKELVDNLTSIQSERIIIEYSRICNLRETMNKMHQRYEDKLKYASITLKDTIEELENDYKLQVDERREVMRLIMTQMDEQSILFDEFCHEVNEFKDRNGVDHIIKLENNLNKERVVTMFWRTKTEHLEKRFMILCEHLATLSNEVQVFRGTYCSLESNIQNLMTTHKEVTQFVADINLAVTQKEKRIDHLSNKYSELTKYKLILTNKIDELHKLSEPKEEFLKNKILQVADLEFELSGLKGNNKTVELELNELKEKIRALTKELKEEKHLVIAARDCLQYTCCKIWYVAQKIGQPKELSRAMKELYDECSNGSSMHKFASIDPIVRDPFQQKRAYMERILSSNKYKSKKKDEIQKQNMYKKQSIVLLEEIEKAETENKRLNNRKNLYSRSSDCLNGSKKSKILSTNPKDDEWKPKY